MAGLPETDSARNSGFRRDDQGDRRYRIVTIYRAPGERYSLPERARDVSVDVLPNGAGVRVTYVTPLREVPFKSTTPPETTRYIN